MYSLSGRNKSQPARKRDDKIIHCFTKNNPISEEKNLYFSDCFYIAPKLAMHEKDN